MIPYSTSCSDGYLKLYLKGQEATDSYEKFDHELCGEESVPNQMVSDGPRLVMVFSSGELQGRGFKAKYTFETGKWHPQNYEFTNLNYPTIFPSNVIDNYLSLIIQWEFKMI